MQPLASITTRNALHEVHRALRSTEAEIRTILEQAAKPDGRLKRGTRLSSIAREAGGLSAAQARAFDRIRDRVPAEPMRCE